MRYAIIEDGQVAEVQLWESGSAPAGAVQLPDGSPVSRGWIYLGGSDFEAPSVDLSVTKAAMWEAIKAERDHRTVTGGYKVAVSGVDKWFHSDVFSRTQQIGLVMLGASANGIQWKTMDGSFVTLSQALAGAIFAAAAAQDQATFAVAEAHRAAMEADEDPASYDFSTNWPAVYQA